tara:strand:+ start:3282 stop:4220 length:939 start_codon:yes stop_codon:yes gene_type:complete
MDDFTTSTLHESRNEWCSRLLTILTPLIMEGFAAIFEASMKLCKENDEDEKYLMTFQNFITRIPKWNNKMIEEERLRIVEKSRCPYLEELIACVHIIQVKLLTAMRVGQKQKKIDIDIPKIDDFIHKCYVNSARQVYKNVYLYETNIMPLQIQKHKRELETIIQECILNTIRESIPVESILKAYLDESVEEDVKEEIKEELISHEPTHPKHAEVVENNEGPNEKPIIEEQRIQFNNTDFTKDTNNVEHEISSPKDIEYLETLQNERKLEEDSNKIQITGEDVQLNELDMFEIKDPDLDIMPDLEMDDIEVIP